MAGTDRTQTATTAESGRHGPAIILVGPQMGENIGAAARGMLNCGLDDLRIVNPRDGWPNDRAAAMASGALDRMPPVSVYTSTAEAVADCHFVLATTARPREMIKQVYTARSGVMEAKKRAATGQKIGFLFGAERTGLINDDIALSHGVITIPLNPGFSSLNLAQAVLLAAYEWLMAGDETPDRVLTVGDGIPAPHAKQNELFERLETELATYKFFRNEGQKPSMIRNLRSLLIRADMTEQEVRTLHGVISALTGKKISD
jgi:tRNA/rRNA methyltransferase